MHHKTSLLPRKLFGTFTLEDSLRGVMKRGYVPWTREELERAYKIYLDEDYMYKSGPKKGKPNIKMIAEEINITFHQNSRVRTYEAVSQALKRYRKKLNYLNF